MFAAIVDFVKGLLGGKGGTQIGSGNQSVTNSTTGSNSPVYAAGRDLHVTKFPSVADEDAEVFADLESLIPDLLENLRKELSESPLLRDIIYVERVGICYNWPGQHLRYAEDESPGVGEQLRLLVNHGLLTHGHRELHYGITERLARYLRKK